MKKIIISTIFVHVIMQISAQINVDINGNVGIGSNLNNYYSQLSVNGAGLNSATVHVNTTNRENGVYSVNYATNSDWTFAFYGKSYIADKKHVGLSGLATNNTPINMGRSFGVIGYSANSTNGYNYGVFGGLGGFQNGGAIVGSINYPWGFGYAINGRYAGFFEGPVMATEAIIAPSFVVPSSTTNITNVSILNNERSYEGIMSLIPVEYEQAHSVELEPEVMDTISFETMSQIERVIAEKKATSHPLFGLVAEEVEKVYPELVHKDSKGNLGVDYIGLIPLLIQTVQQLDAEVKSLRTEEENEKIGSLIGQNVQLSVNGSCNIEYTIPEVVKLARLNIYGISGKLVDSYMLEGRGNGTFSVDTRKLGKGIYIYTLIADGYSIDSHQMIVQ